MNKNPFANERKRDFYSYPQTVMSEMILFQGAFFALAMGNVLWFILMLGVFFVLFFFSIHEDFLYKNDKHFKKVLPINYGVMGTLWFFIGLFGAVPIGVLLFPFNIWWIYYHFKVYQRVYDKVNGTPENQE